jgi:hypothetical protein
MSFFNRKKKKIITVQTVSASSLMRKLIYDGGCRYPEDIAELVGLNRVSDDVAEMEIEASDLRLDRLIPIMPIIESHAVMSAQISAMSYIHTTMSLDEELPDQEVFESLVNLFRAVSLSASISCLSSMLDLDVISERY